MNNLCMCVRAWKQRENEIFDEIIYICIAYILDQPKNKKAYLIGYKKRKKYFQMNCIQES